MQCINRFCLAQAHSITQQLLVFSMPEKFHICINVFFDPLYFFSSKSKRYDDFPPIEIDTQSISQFCDGKRVIEYQIILPNEKKQKWRTK